MEINISMIQQESNSNNSNNYASSSSVSSVTRTSMINENYENTCKETSCVYVYNTMNDQKIYRLKFRAIEVSMEPLVLNPRSYVQNETDKCLQPRSKRYYLRNKQMYHHKINSLMRIYELDYKNDTVSIMSNKRAVLEPIKYEKLPKKSEKQKISNKKSNLGRSIVHINHNNVCFKIHMGMVELKSIKSIDYQREENKKIYLQKHNLLVNEYEPNTGQIIVHHKSDVLKFRFKLSQVCYEYISEKISIGLEVKDDDSYIRSYSTYNERTVYIPLPKTTYRYVDPMIKVKYSNNLLKLNNIKPAWKKGVRDKRINEYKKCHSKKVGEQLNALKSESILLFDNRNQRFRTKSGVATLKVNQRKYEDWIIDYQRTKEAEKMEKMKTNTKQDDKKDNLHQNTFVTNADINDWDLVMNYV